MFYPVLICTFAGLSTALGAVVVILAGNISNEKMSFSQGFAAGVMVAVSVLDLLPESFFKYYVYMNALTAFKAVASLFFCGWVAGTAISLLAVPVEFKTDADSSLSSAARMAALTTLVMVIHNLPEGMLTIFTSAEDISFGLKMALAVALHNLPEGMAIASPVLYVTKSRAKAFFQSLMAGMAEPFGGLLAYLILQDILTPAFLNGFMPVVAGVMCQTAICELIPYSAKISNIKHTIYGIITGIITMSIGLFLF